MKNILMPCILVSELPTDEAFEILRQFSYGYDYPPDAGFSFIVLSSSLEGYSTEWANMILSKIQGEKFFLVICDSDQEYVDFVNNQH